MERCFFWPVTVKINESFTEKHRQMQKGCNKCSGRNNVQSLIRRKLVMQQRSTTRVATQSGKSGEPRKVKEYDI